MVFPQLDGAQYMSLMTFRRSGEAVATPVWFAEGDGRLYVLTQDSSGKAKRIRNNPRVVIAPCTASGKVTGEPEDAMARFLEESEYAAAIRLLNRKYGLFKRLFDVMLAVTRRRKSIIYLEIAAAVGGA